MGGGGRTLRLDSAPAPAGGREGQDLCRSCLLRGGGRSPRSSGSLSLPLPLVPCWFTGHGTGLENSAWSRRELCRPPGLLQPGGRVSWGLELWRRTQWWVTCGQGCRPWELMWPF